MHYWILLLLAIACVQNEHSDQRALQSAEQELVNASDPIDTAGRVITTRFIAPSGYFRKDYTHNSFSYYLSHLPLKTHGSKVLYYHGGEKHNYNVYVGVVDLAVGQRDLHQCADAVMRLRAEYLWHNKMYDRIHFNFTNGFRADYSRWRRGERIKVSGNHVKWAGNHGPSDSYEDFWKYLEMVFSYAGTASLEKELNAVKVEDAQIGDIFIQGGFPGHAVIIVDKVYSPSKNKSLYLLAPSYMPAQEIQILKNPSHDDNPWYDFSDGDATITPEWTFNISDLKRF